MYMHLPTNFCAAPFLQHTTHPSGSCSPCPYLGGTTWAGQNTNILQQWTSPALEQLREDFLNNNRSPICNRCWHEEDNNKSSLRLRLFDPVNKTSDFSFGTHELIEQRLTDKNYLTGPTVLTIKNGNLCNAKCRVCHPGDSSKWAADADKLFKITGKQYYALNQVETNWSADQLDEIVELSKNIVRLELFGGEPTYNKQVSTLLDRLANSGISKNITLYINTNGSGYIPDRFPSIDKFKHVEIGVSFDGVGKHFNYIRHGLEFDVAVDNVRRTNQFFKDRNLSYWIDSISTVSILNVYYLPELRTAVKELLPLDPFWNLLIDPGHLFIKNMPLHVKEAVIEKLSNDESYQDLISVINQPADEKCWEQFLEITESLDTIRGESFKDTFPEFYQIIQNKF